MPTLCQSFLVCRVDNSIDNSIPHNQTCLMEAQAGTTGAQPVVDNTDAAVEPSPDIPPERVIEIQLNAMKNNDVPEKDAGIATTFKFASPANKAATGPLPRFISMVHNPLYEPLLNHKRAKFVPVGPNGDKWQITVTDKHDNQHVYIWRLSKQVVPPYQGCWMTDAVMLM